MPLNSSRQLLGPDDVKRRIEAARTLRGVSQRELAARLHEDGLGSQELGRIERGDLPLTRVRIDALCRHLGVPERWFTEPDVDELLSGTAEPATDAASFIVATMRDLANRLEARLDAIEKQLAESAADQVERELERAAERSERDERDERGERGTGR